MPTLPLKIGADAFVFLITETLALTAWDEDFVIGAMRQYGGLRIDEFLEAQRREAEGADIYASCQLPLPLTFPVGAAGGGDGA